MDISFILDFVFIKTRSSHILHYGRLILFFTLLWSGGPGKRADPARRRGTTGKPEEDHNIVHD